MMYIDLINAIIEAKLMHSYKIKYDKEFYDELSNKYKLLLSIVKDKTKDSQIEKHVKIHTQKVLEAIREYYKGNISKSHSIILNIVKKCSDQEFMDFLIEKSGAHGPDEKNHFFRARGNECYCIFSPKEMAHLPFSMRGKTGNYRFSIPGIPSLYLGKSSYVCWLELGCPPEYQFNVSHVIVDPEIKCFSLALPASEEIYTSDDFNENNMKLWLVLLILKMATSCVIEEGGRTFKSEYIISQSIMLACKKCEYDGVFYYSNRIDYNFSCIMINLALFTPYTKKQEYSRACQNVKISYSVNFMHFKTINNPLNITPIGTCLPNFGEHPRIKVSPKIFPYYEYTSFCDFDKFLLSSKLLKDVSFGNVLQENA